MFRYLVKNCFEYFGSQIIGEVLWPPSSVAVLAEGEHEDVLVLDRGDGLELPGGMVKRGEDLREAGRRELKEETGFEVEVGDLIDIISTDTGIHFFYHGKVVGGERNGSWEGEPVFLDKAEVDEKVWRPEHSHIHEYVFPEE